ncbi:MAG TPA: NUDIX domain-containing protein, partial [Marmoricola sp.]
EVSEEAGLHPTIRSLLGIHDSHLTGNAPDGRREDFHAVNIVYEASVPPGQQPVVREVDGTTDAVDWVDVTDIEAGSVEVTELVRFALALD